MTGSPDTPRPWTVESTRAGYSDRFLTHRMDRCVTDRGHVLDPFHVLELKEWCHVVAVTDAGDLVLVDEYRHGAGAVVRGLPAGTVEAGEDPALAMPRELAEETGHTAATWIRLPTLWANPAMQTNRVHNFLALGARATGEQTLDPGESIAVVLVPVATAVGDIMSGAWTTHGLHVAAILAAREYALARAAGDPRLAPLAAPAVW